MKKLYYLLIAFVASIGLTFTACSDDDLGASINDTNDYPLDRSSYTFPLDTFIKKNFLEPYNLKFIYRMEDVGTDMQKNLIPASYEKSIDLAVLTKHLWLDVYRDLASDVFLKINSPKIIHVIGSPGYNSDGSRTVGVAEGGINVTLMEVNALDVNQIEGPRGLNELFFHTMHHEFGHILDQKHIRPSQFNTISSGLYDAVGWSDKNDSIQAALGFVTPYASMQQGEDWVETLACYVTYDQDRWNQLLETASFDWEEIDFTYERYDSLFYNYDENGKRIGRRKTVDEVDMDTIGYLRQTANYEYKVDRKLVKRDGDGWVQVDSLGNYEYVHADNIDGTAVILEKLDLVRQWLKDNWNIDIDALREEVQSRQYVKDDNGEFLRDENGNFINRLTYRDPKDPTKPTVYEQLLEEINFYKTLKTN